MHVNRPEMRLERLKLADDPNHRTDPRSGLEMRLCRFCGDQFQPKRKWQEFCDTKCRNNFHNDKKYEEVKKCPHCTNSVQSMLDKIGPSFYYCEVCSKEFEV